MMRQFLRSFVVLMMIESLLFSGHLMAAPPQYEKDFQSGNLRFTRLQLSHSQLGANYYGGTPDLDKLVYYLASSDPLAPEPDTDVSAILTALDLASPSKDVSSRSTTADRLWGLLKDPQRAMPGSTPTDLKIDKGLADLTIALLYLRSTLQGADPKLGVNELARLGTAKNPHALYWTGHLFAEGFSPLNIVVSFPNAVPLFQTAIASTGLYTDAAAWLSGKGFLLKQEEGTLTAAEREAIRAKEAARLGWQIDYLAKRNIHCARCSNALEIFLIIFMIAGIVLPSIIPSTTGETLQGLSYTTAVLAALALALRIGAKKANSEALEASTLRQAKLRAAGFTNPDEGLSNPSADDDDRGPSAGASASLAAATGATGTGSAAATHA